MADLRVEWVSDEERFAALAEPWERLAEPTRLPFLRHAWFACWWDAFGARRRLAVCSVWDGDELAAVFPLCARGRTLEPLANAQTPAFAPLGRPDALRVAIEAAVAASGVVEIPAAPAGDAASDLLADVSRGRGRVVLRESHHVSPFVDTRGSWQDYRAGLGKNARKDTERRRRKLESAHDVEVAAVVEPERLEAALEEGLELEASGWKGRRGTAILSSAETARFYRSLAAAFAADGRLRFSTIHADGKPVAFDYCLLDHGRLWSLKVGVDDDFRRFAPGIVLTLAEIERSFELGLDALELLGGNEQWKQKFATGSRPHENVRSYARAPVPLGRWAYRRTLRPWLLDAYRRLNDRRRTRSR